MRESPVDGVCLCNPGFGYTSATDDSSCIACHYACETCTIGGVNGECTTCKANRTREGSGDKKSCTTC